MSFTDVQKERCLTAYVQELLSLDRARQQATLENLSKYADTSPVTSPVTNMASLSHSPVLDQDLGISQGVLKAGQAQGRMFQAEEMPTPVKVDLPSNRAGNEDLASNRLQHATQVLQAALANWEACMQGNVEANGQRAQASVPEVAVPGTVGPPPGLRATEERAKKVNEYAKTLEKALNNLNHSLPPEGAEKALNLLDMVAKEEASKIEAQEKLKWLATLLQSQNQASLGKVYKMLKEPQPTQMPAAAMPRVPGGLDARTVQLAAALGQFGTGVPAAQWPYAMPNVAQAMGNMAPVGAQPYLPAQGPAPTWWPNTGAERTQGTNTARKGGGPKKRNNESAQGQADTHSGDTLRMHLRSLLQVDSSRVLIVRKINRLGFSSPQILREHFSWYGTVENVLVAHSRVKSGGGQAGIVSRLRPSGLGFVVMSKGEEALKILAEGAEQQVAGTVIRVQKFERRMSESAAGLEELDEKEQEPCSSESRAMGG